MLTKKQKELFDFLKQYIENSKSILFGTNSFWEGIDLPEELLEVLIILKVPFSAFFRKAVFKAFKSAQRRDSTALLVLFGKQEGKKL